MKAFFSITLILFTKAVSSQLLKCGEPAIADTNSTTQLKCNTSSPIIELYWGVKSSEEPVPVLIIVDPSGERPGVNIASTNYGGRVFFLGNKATGDATIEIRKVMASDAKDYLWKVDHGGGLYKRYVMSLTVTKPSTTTAPTTKPSTSSSTIGSSSSTTTTTPPPSSTTAPPPTTSTTTPKGLSGGEIAGIAIGAVIGVIIVIAIIVVGIKKSKKSHQDNLPADKKKDTEMNSPPAANA